MEEKNAKQKCGIKECKFNPILESLIARSLSILAYFICSICNFSTFLKEQLTRININQNNQRKDKTNI